MKYRKPAANTYYTYFLSFDIKTHYTNQEVEYNVRN